MADIGNSLTKAFDYVWVRFLGRLEGLGDAEYFWEPVPGCWSVRQGTGGRWAMDGGTAPEPAPVTTIAYRRNAARVAAAVELKYWGGSMKPHSLNAEPLVTARR